jgi:hypothetical protein
MGTKKGNFPDIETDPKDVAWRTPVQQELDGLFDELKAFNERIAELAKDGHQSHAVSVLKAQAFSLARQIDELRGILVVPRQPAKGGRKPL